jgi:putative sulfotransferase
LREEPVSIPTFIVGTGRCGSTMLSNMIREHPRILGLSEFFISVTDCARTPQAMEQAFPQDAIDGPTFWKIIAP